MRKPRMVFSLVAGVLVLRLSAAYAGIDRVNVAPNWDRVFATSRAAVTIQVCPEPLMRRGHPLHDKIYSALQNLNADYARLQPWYPYPNLSVAELKPPKDGKTFWDFVALDEITEDFINATNGHPVVVNFGTVPDWIFTGTPGPLNPDGINWSYGAEAGPGSAFMASPGKARRLTDEAISLMASYQARVAGWYMSGGFKDEYGVWHTSGHHYRFAYWEVLSEPDLEHGIDPADYTRVYDAVVAAVSKVAPKLKFIGVSIADPIMHPRYFTYFLNANNHRPGIDRGMIAYHFYSLADPDEPPDVYQYAGFEQMDKLLTATRYINAIRDQLSPDTKIAVNELGSMLPAPAASKLAAPIPQEYWNLAGAMWAYAYGNLAGLGVELVGGAELIDYPGQVAATSLLDWETGEPNSRYWILSLLRQNFGPGDRLVAAAPTDIFFSSDPNYQIYYQGFLTPAGERKILIVNKRNRTADLRIATPHGASVRLVNQTTMHYPDEFPLQGDFLRLTAFTVAVVTLNK